MKTAKIISSFLLLATAVTVTNVEASAQRLGPTVYGFGTGAPGPGLLPRTLEMDPPTLGTSPNVTLSNGNPNAPVLLCYGSEPLFSPMQLFGADVFINPELLLATRFVPLDSNGSAQVSFGPIPYVRTLTGATIYGQFVELNGSSLLHSTAFAAQAATGCGVRVQGTMLVFGNAGNAFFQGISVSAGCSYRIVGQSVALPAAGVTITGHTGVGDNHTVTFTHAGIPVGTDVSIMLEVECTCNGVVSQHFLFARGTK